MAEQPKYFDIEDTQTGKKYRVETDDPSATYEEAVEYFSTLPETDWQAFELKAPAKQAPAPEAVAPVSAASPTGNVSVAAPREARKINVTADDYELGMDKFLDFSPEVKTLGNPDQVALLNMANDPNVPVEQINSFLQERGIQPGDESFLASIQEARDKGVAFGSVTQDDLFAGMVDQGALNKEYAPESDNFFSQIGRSVTSGWADPASLVNAISRGGSDFFDIYEDELRKQFPDATPEEMAELEDQYIGYISRMRSKAAEEAVKDDDFAPWLIGQFMAIEPYDVIPVGRAAKAGTRAGRIAEQAALGAGVATVGDVAGQALAMRDYAQDDFDPIRTAASAGISGVLAGGGQYAGELINSVRKAGPNNPPPTAPEGNIVIPSGKKNTKAYRAQLATTQDQIVNQVNAVAGKWTNAPDVEVHANFAKLDGIDNDAIGVYTTKTLEDGSTVPVIKINTEAVLARAKQRDVSPESVVEAVTFHEGLGHHGLTQLFREDLDAFLDDVYVNGAEEFRDKVDEWLRKNPSSYANYDPVSRRILATEEVLAGWSEKGPLPKTFVDNVLNLIKDFGRQMGVTFNINKLKDIKYTSREVRAYLAVANDRTVSGTKGGATPSAPRNMDERTPDTTSAGFKQPKADDRSRAEARKQLWKNKENPNWNPDDANGLPPSTFVPEAKARKYLFETGKPVTVEGLHGTSAEFEDFDPSNLGAVTGAPSAKKAFWFATRKETAQTYAAWSARDRWFGNERKPARVLKRAIRLDNPLVVDMKSSVYREDSFRNILDKAYEAGHDGVILRNAYDSGETSRLDAWLRLNFKGENLIAVFDPKNILRESPETGNKYMRGDGPLDPDQISADDLIEANNALDILNRLEYTPTVISPDQLESEAIARNLPPSDITRLVGLEPGKLMKKLFLYDVAATKLSDRAAKIKGDIDANGLTPERQLAYLETTFKLSELTAKIFDFQAEIGRTLAANRRVNFSRKRVKDLKTLLEQYGAEALADPETFMRYMAEIDAQANGREKVTTTKDRVISIVNIPRAIMSSADLSAPLRQGVVFISYPQYWKSFAKMFTMLGSSGERNYKFLMEKIAKHPNYELMQKSRLAFSSLDGELSAREEDFQTELARKIPLFGKVVKASEQAYAGFLNKLRADMFNRFVEDYRKAGIEPDDETLKGIGKFINAGTGRAELPEFLRPSSTIINATFFSGRLMYSRVQMLNPWFYAKLPPQVRKEAARSMLGFAGVAGLVAGSINALWPDDVETELDPRSSDFMKIKIDNTRFDIGGGFNQYLVLGARTATWMYNNSLAFTDRQLGTDVSEFQIANKITAGGDERKYGTDEFAQETLGGAIAQFLRSKLSPQASYFIDMINEQDVIGREFTVEGSLASRLVPMTASSIYDAYKEDSPVPMPVVFTATIFGVGVNTYTVPGMDPEKELKPPVTFDMKDLADGQNDLIRAEGGVVTLKPAARKRWEETLNNYYPFFVEEVAAEMGLKFEDMDDDMKKSTVKEATKRARYNAKEDMMYELGLAE